MRHLWQKLRPIAAMLAITACTEKSEETETQDFTVDQTITVSQPDAGPAVNPIVAQVATNSSSPSVTGLPARYTTVDSISVTIAGTGITHYKADLLAGESDCSGATFDDWVEVATAFASDTGSEGDKRLCIIFSGETTDGAPFLSSFEHVFTKDLTNPAGVFDAVAGFGPGLFPGSTVTVTGNASDSVSSVASSWVSVQESGGSCLNDAKTAFDQTCPHYLAADGEADWAFSFPKASLTNDTNYIFRFQAIDQAGNTGSDLDSETLLWDTTAPAAPASVTATGGQESMSLSWASVVGATNYLVLQRKDQALAYTPTAGESYAADQFLGDDQVVVYVGSSTTANRSELDPFTEYFYSVYALDASGNISSSADDSAITEEIPRFKGVVAARPIGKGRKIEVTWRAFDDGPSAHANVTYKVFTSATSGGQDFDSSPDASITGATRLVFEDSGSSDDLYIVVRDADAGGTEGTNTREAYIRFAAGSQHKLTFGRRYDGQDKLEAYIQDPYAIDTDPWGNVVFSMESGMLAVMCQETTNAYYCKDRTVDKIYTIAGQDGRGDGENGVDALATSMGIIYGIEFDAAGNLFIADHTYFRIRAICYDPRQPGFCLGKTPGQIYHAAGTGLAGNGSNNADALLQRMDNPRDVTVDSDGNFYFIDDAYEYVRVVCMNTASSICSGKTKGYVYHIAGTGVAADGADNIVALGGEIGTIYSLDVDSNANIYLADYTYYKVRAICYDVSAGTGFCDGKTSGNMYTITGTGSNGDAGDNVAASGQSVGRSYGLEVDPNFNIWYSDTNQRKIRVICEKTGGGDYCDSLTAGNIYHFAFTGSAGDGADGEDAKTVARAHTIYDLDVNANGNVLIGDMQYERIRSICQDVGSADFCNGQTAGEHYRAIGAGSSRGAQSSFGVPSITSVHGDVTAVALDSKGNIFFSDYTGDRVFVHCTDVSGSTGACGGRTEGYSYVVAGTGTAGEDASGTTATSARLNNPYGLSVDSNGNLFISDYSNERIKVLCYENTNSRICNGETIGTLVYYAGTSSTADGGDDEVATSSNIGRPVGLAHDSNDNLYFADLQNHRLRVVCEHAASCVGSTVGNIYWFAGTGSAGNDDTGVATSAATNDPSAVAIDHLDNVYFSDHISEKIRVVCQDVSSAGVCNGRTVGNVYLFAGSGSSTNCDFADNISATDSTCKLRDAYGLTTDPVGNVYIADGVYGRVRVICNETTSGACAGKTVGNIYRLYGAGSATDYASNVDASITRMGNAYFDGIAMTADGDIIFVDASYDAVRFITAE